MSMLILPVWNLLLITSKFHTHVLINEITCIQDGQRNEIT